MMDTSIEAFAKLAQELTDRVDSLEKENAELKKTAAAAAEQVKQASEQKKDAEVVSRAVVDATLDALVKCGGLNLNEVDKSREIMLRDAEAPHRILQKFLDAERQEKTASDTDNVTGGTLMGSTSNKKDTARDACLDRMASLLGMN